MKRRILLEDSKLLSQLTDSEPSELAPISMTDFAFKSNSFYHLRFNSDDSGEIVSIEQYYRSRLVGKAMKVKVVI